LIHARINGVVINAAAEHYPGFWQRAADGVWEPSTYAAIDRHVTADTVFLDIGSHIGAITLYAAHRASRVISVEADPRSLAMLEANIAVNPIVAGRITVVAKAIHPTRERVVLGSRAEGGDSMSSLVLTPFKTTWTVESVTPEDLAAMLPRDRPIFVKMDIERGEYLVVPRAGALWSHPHLVLLLSLHPELFEGRLASLRSALGARRILKALGAYTASSVDERVLLFTRKSR
jgi:FkbM family methyltransferase